MAEIHLIQMMEEKTMATHSKKEARKEQRFEKPKSVREFVIHIIDMVIIAGQERGWNYRTIVAELNEILAPENNISMSAFNKMSAYDDERFHEPKASTLIAMLIFLEKNGVLVTNTPIVKRVAQ